MSTNYDNISEILKKCKINTKINNKNYLIDLIELLDQKSNESLWKIRRDYNDKKVKETIELILDYRKDVSCLFKHDLISYFKTYTDKQLKNFLRDTYKLNFNREGDYPENYEYLLKKELNLRKHISNKNESTLKRKKISKKTSKLEKKNKKLKEKIFNLRSKRKFSVGVIANRLKLSSEEVLIYLIDLGLEDFSISGEKTSYRYDNYYEEAIVETKSQKVELKNKASLLSNKFGLNKKKLKDWNFQKVKEKGRLKAKQKLKADFFY